MASFLRAKAKVHPCTLKKKQSISKAAAWTNCYGVARRSATWHCSPRLSLLKIDRGHLKTERCIILHPLIFIQQTPKVFRLCEMRTNNR